jgi:hypothetical protein
MDAISASVGRRLVDSCVKTLMKRMSILLSWCFAVTAIMISPARVFGRGPLHCLHHIVEWANRNSTNRRKNFPAGVRLAKQATGFELAKLLRRKTL